jgi:outer membrane protein assembly factor BamC
MLKKTTLVTISVLSLLLAACSTNQRYKREINGNESYLDTPPLKKLTVPENLVMPVEIGDYYINPVLKEGNTGKNVDIRPPIQPLASLSGSYAYRDRNSVVLDAPSSMSIWDKIPAILAEKGITIESHNAQELRTAVTNVTRVDDDISHQASYAITYRNNGARQYVTVNLISLTANGNDIMGDKTENQRYSVDFFNMILLALKQIEMNQTNTASQQ